MKRVYQTEEDDCFRACIASFLELDAEKVPNFCTASATGDIMFDKMRRWLVKRYALSLVTIVRPPETKLVDWIATSAIPTRFIATVPVYGARDWHCVIAGIYGPRIRKLHDPGRHDRIRLTEMQSATILVAPEALPRSVA